MLCDAAPEHLKLAGTLIHVLDDSEDQCNAWKKAGGEAIHLTSDLIAQPRLVSKRMLAISSSLGAGQQWQREKMQTEDDGSSDTLREDEYLEGLPNDDELYEEHSVGDSYTSIPEEVYANALQVQEKADAEAAEAAETAIDDESWMDSSEEPVAQKKKKKNKGKPKPKPDATTANVKKVIQDGKKK